MKTISKRRLAAIAAALAVVGGGSVAAVTALGQGTGRHARHHLRTAARGLSRRDMRAAVAYLGISQERLVAELQSGKTPAQIADSTPGKSSAGLAAALVAEKRQRLAIRSAAVGKRVNAELNGSHTGTRLASAGGHAGAAGSARLAPRVGLVTLAAGYLGLPAGQLQADLDAGKTLAQIAASTPGKSAAGLIAALLEARRERLVTAVALQKMSQERSNEVGERQLKRIEALVNRRLAVR